MVTDLGKGQPNLTDVEISALGKLIYRQNIRPHMTEQDIGKFVYVDVHSGQYEIAGNMLDATHKLRTRVPDACGFMIRVGYSAPVFLGWHEEPEL
jgi:hypothetical protein